MNRLFIITTPAMNKLTLILCIALLISGGQQKSKTDPKITFYKVNGRAVLLGENIKLLDENYEEVKDISYLNEHFVEVAEVS